MKKYSVILLVLTFCLITVGSSVWAEDYATLRSDYRQLVSSPALQQQRLSWERLIKRFNAFVSRSDSKQNLENASFLRARTWDGLAHVSGRSSDAQIAIEVYTEFVDLYPDSRLSDDALFSAAVIAEDLLEDNNRAYQLFQRILLEYDNGDMAGDARNHFVSLKKPVSTASYSSSGAASHTLLGSAPTLENIRYWSGPEYTRIVLDLNAPVATTPQLLKGDAPRIYFDLRYTKLAADLPASVTIGNGLVLGVRTSPYDPQTSRVVIDLNRIADYKISVLQNPHRLVVDVMGAPEKVVLTAPVKDDKSLRSDDSIAGILDTVPDDQKTLHVPQQRRDEGIRTIVVDAGHGGKDPGAIGPGGVYEKTVTLAMAKALATSLRQRLGVKVLLTRSDDRFIELRERTAFANRVNADLFISLHANASRSSGAYGVESYFLNLSKNGQAAEVAARENGTNIEDVGNLEAILFDLMANAKINESSRLAAEVQQSLVAGLSPHYSKIKDLGVKQGPFHVLLGATMPSVLVEAAFISNNREEKRLTSKAYQQRVADAIVDGIKHYSASFEQVAHK